MNELQVINPDGTVYVREDGKEVFPWRIARGIAGSIGGTVRADGRGGWVGSTTHGPFDQPDRPEVCEVHGDVLTPEGHTMICATCCAMQDAEEAAPQLTAVLRQHLAAEAIVRGTR